MIRKLYPYGKPKAFNITYDDGVLQDVPFVRLLNELGIPGTFNLNSQLMQEEFAWTHPCGAAIRRLPPQTVRHLYDGHEVASHTLTHPYMTELSREEILYQLKQDKANLEALFEREIFGFAVPFDYYDDTIRQCVIDAGFAYGRNSEQSLSFTPQADPFCWSTTVYHINPEMSGLFRQFLESHEELALFQIVGHSYDLETENLWPDVESILRTVRSHDDILPMTHIDIVRYLQDMAQVTITDTFIENRSPREVWLEIDGHVTPIPAGARISGEELRKLFGT